jgi:hypothetical protein
MLGTMRCLRVKVKENEVELFHVENVFCSGCSHAADRQRVGTSGARSFVATIEQGMRELEHRGSMSAAAACGAVVAEDAAADPRDHRT